MSAQGQITDFLRAFKPERGRIPLSPNQIALQTGISREQVNKTLSNLKTRNRVELLRGKNGRDIVGIKPIDLEPRQRGGRRTNGVTKQARVRLAEPMELKSDHSKRVLSIRTPVLDEYGKSKERFEALKEELGDLVEATFRGNPYAEEGLQLRARLALQEARLVELEHECEEQARDLRALRGRKQGDIAARAERAGAVAKSGD